MPSYYAKERATIYTVLLPLCIVAIANSKRRRLAGHLLGHRLIASTCSTTTARRIERINAMTRRRIGRKIAEAQRRERRATRLNTRHRTARKTTTTFLV